MVGSGVDGILTSQKPYFTERFVLPECGCRWNWALGAPLRAVRGGGHSSVVEHTPVIPEALGSIPSASTYRERVSSKRPGRVPGAHPRPSAVWRLLSRRGAGAVSRPRQGWRARTLGGRKASV